jgi:putative heme-binding domain-containing protein
VELPVDLAKLAHRALSAAGRSDPKLLTVLNDTIGIEDTPTEYDAKLVRALAAEAMATGDADRGRAIFSSELANCNACHRIAGRGGDKGPDLTIVGAGRSPELLTESLLFPSRQIREGYMSRLVITNDGRVFNGYRLKETDDELHLRDTTTNRVRRIAKSSIQSVTDAGSIMPVGVTSALTRRERRDLIRFLSELGRTGGSERN